MDRRDFLTASLMAVAALKGNAAQMTPPATTPVAPQPSWSAARFQDLVGTRFQLASESWRGQVHLAEVLPGPEAPDLEQFTTVFRSDELTAPTPGVYDVEHDQAGRFALRLDGQDASPDRLAAFSLLRV